MCMPDSLSRGIHKEFADTYLVYKLQLSGMTHQAACAARAAAQYLVLAVFMQASFCMSFSGGYVVSLNLVHLNASTERLANPQLGAIKGWGQGNSAPAVSKHDLHPVSMLSMKFQSSTDEVESRIPLTYCIRFGDFHRVPGVPGVLSGLHLFQRGIFREGRTRRAFWLCCGHRCSRPVALGWRLDLAQSAVVGVRAQDSHASMQACRTLQFLPDAPSRMALR